MNNNNNSNKFLNGFLLGALIGGGIVFLLNSKKGKKILKIISEGGLDNISDLLSKQEELVTDDEDEEFVEDKESNSSKSQNTIKHTNGETKQNPESEKKPLVKRFFRGISRKH